MADDFLTFQTFADDVLALEMAEQLRQNGIAPLIENNRVFYDPSYANNSFGSDITLKIRASDFGKARQVLEQYYQKDIENIDRSYHLFQFTDEELIEIVTKPDEWGFLDYQLAQKILKERGKEVNPELVLLLKKQRNKDLETPETAHRYWITAGYIFAFLGGLIGVVIAWTLSYFKKTLPDGRRVFVYREADRDHGSRILLISCISMVFWFFVRVFIED
jgi:hypothetical protein